MTRHDVEAVDAFELPGWVGETEVRWTALSSLDGEHLVTGRLEGGGETGDCDLLACDQAWVLEQVHLLRYDGRLTLVMPGSTIGSEIALEALRRLAKAVGAPPQRFSVVLRL